ncbi:hypothetical protein CL654_00250 [bacterium]|nr:hypothetical protein [bacterium]
MAEHSQKKQGPVTKEADALLEDLDLPPIRTLQGDLANLLEKNKLTEGDFKKLDKNLRRETESYRKKGGDKKAGDMLKLFAEETESVTSKKDTGPDEISKLFSSPKDTFVDKASKKARIDTEKLKKNLIYESGDGGGPLPKGDSPKPAPKKAEEEKTDPSIILPQKNSKEKEGQTPIVATQSPITPKKESPKDHTDGIVGGTPVRTLPKIVKKPPPPPPPKPNPLVELEKERMRIQNELQSLPAKEQVIDQNIQKLNEQKERLTNFLNPLVQKEAEIEERITQIETQEAQTPDVATRKQLEQTRWTLEDQRRETEEKRWQADQEIIKLQKDIEEAAGRKQTFTNKRTSLELELTNLDKKKRALLAEKELNILRDKLEEVETMKEPLELEWISLNERKERDTSDLTRLTNEEEGVLAKLRDVEIQERETSDPNQRHSFEVERWKTEEARREIEKNKWSLEEELENITNGMKELGIKYKKVLEAEALIEEKIEELETLQSEVEVSTNF